MSILCRELCVIRVVLLSLLFLRHVAECLPDLDLLSSLHLEFKCLWCLEYEHDRASETEPAHLFGGPQGLPIE